MLLAAVPRRAVPCPTPEAAAFQGWAETVPRYPLSSFLWRWGQILIS